jgi:signal transduction histidine kinase
MSLVLVADDEPAVLEVLTEVIEDLGHDVVRAHDGREALSLARAQHPNLVVTDHMMPRLSGLELCRALRKDEALGMVPVILLSAAIPPEADEASAWLPKPFELDVFETLVKDTLAGTGKRSPSSTSLPAVGRLDHAEEAHELLDWVSHELKTPLAAARMNLQLLDRKMAASGQQMDRHHFRSVTRQLETMDQIVNSLVDLARLSEGTLALNLAREDLAAIVLNAVDHAREDHPDVQFEVLAGGPVRVAVDADRIEQILARLLSNAVRHGGAARNVRVGLTRADGSVSVSVQDFGAGIPPAIEDTLFQRPRSAGSGVARSKRPPGLGLYIAHELARLHDGKLSVRSVPGSGATFTLALPLT